MASSVVGAATWGFSKGPMHTLLQSYRQSARRASHSTCTAEEVDGGARSGDELSPLTVSLMGAVALVEKDPQVQTVGIFSFPNASGHIQLDAALIELTSSTTPGPPASTLVGEPPGGSLPPGQQYQGRSRFGGVMGLEGFEGSIHAAGLVLQHSPHTYLVGEGAKRFVEEHGLQPSPTKLPTYLDAPSFGDGDCRRGVKETQEEGQTLITAASNENNKGHDTVGFIAFDLLLGQMTVGVSSSGMKDKHPGRVGDSPIIGSGLYAEVGVGGAVVTGDGDTIATFPLAFLVVAEMKRGLTPSAASKAAVEALMLLPQTPSTAEIGICAISWKGEQGGDCSPAWKGTYEYVTGQLSNEEGGEGVERVDVVVR